MKKMNLSKTGSILLLSMCLGLAMAGCAKKEEPKETVETTKAVEESSTEETKTPSTESQEEDVIENVDYIYTANNNGNIVIENEGYDELKAAVEEFNKGEETYKKSKGIGEGSEYDIYTRVVRADSKVFSIISKESVYRDLDTGSDADKYNFNTINYNSKDGKELKLSDIADDGIYKVLTDELKKTYPDVKFGDDSESKLKEELAKTGWESKAAWILNYDGIIFYIQKELVSTDAKGVLVYGVSFGEHKDVIKQSYTSKPESYIYPIFSDANYPVKIDNKIVRFSISSEDKGDMETIVNIEVAGKKTDPIHYMYTPNNIHLVNVKGEMFMMIEVPVGDVSYLTDIFKLDNNNGAIELNEVEQSVAEEHFSNDPSHIMMAMLEGEVPKSEYMEFNTDGTFKKVE